MDRNPRAQFCTVTMVTGGGGNCPLRGAPCAGICASPEDEGAAMEDERSSARADLLPEERNETQIGSPLIDLCACLRRLRAVASNTARNRHQSTNGYGDSGETGVGPGLSRRCESRRDGKRWCRRDPTRIQSNISCYAQFRRKGHDSRPAFCNRGRTPIRARNIWFRPRLVIQRLGSKQEDS